MVDKIHVKSKITQANTVADMNKIRGIVVEAKDPEILLMWQDKYWKLKRKEQDL